METTELIELNVSMTSTDYSAALGLRVLLDDNVIYESTHVAGEVEIKHTVSDADAEHNLIFELFGKKLEHTKINEAGEILTDALLSIDSIEIDGIDILQMFKKISVYQYNHDFNGSQAPINDKFYGHMGCNGTVTLKFTTPIYLWLLENM
jgi:hypothetical protein